MEDNDGEREDAAGLGMAAREAEPEPQESQPKLG